MYIPVASRPVVKNNSVEFVALSFDEAEAAKEHYG